MQKWNPNGQKRHQYLKFKVRLVKLYNYLSKPSWFISLSICVCVYICVCVCEWLILRMRLSIRMNIYVYIYIFRSSLPNLEKLLISRLRELLSFRKKRVQIYMGVYMTGFLRVTHDHFHKGPYPCNLRESRHNAWARRTKRTHRNLS